MKKSAFIISLVAAFCGMLAVGACAGIGRDVWHYKMTVTIATPEGDKTGSSVREVTGSHNLKLTPESCGYCVGLAKGEAVVVDLGKRGIAFGLLFGNPGGIDYGHQIFFESFPQGKDSGLVELDRKNYPTFAAFSDLNDQNTVKEVSGNAKEDIPYGNGDKKIYTFEHVFGTGVYVKSITIQMTKEPVTKKIDSYLVWLKNLTNGYLLNKSSSLGVPYGMGQSYFERGE